MWGLLLACALVCLLKKLRSLPSPCLWALAAFAAGVVTNVLMAAAFQPPAQQYYFYAALPLGWVLLGLCSAQGCTWARDPKHRGLRALGYIFLLTVLIRCGLFWWTAPHRRPNLQFAEFTTAAHALEMKPMLAREIPDPLDTTILVTGQHALRANAYWSTLQDSHFPKMMFSEQFREFRSVREYHPRRGQEKLGLLVACGEAEDTDPQRIMKHRALKSWRIVEECALTGCTTCSACRAWKLTRYEGWAPRPRLK
ncbi:MAG: hypothetical protein EBZ48_00805 [Proteobacteria bacterium]|nr:hypothetical protein [Pseudomonadota bacterium]